MSGQRLNILAVAGILLISSALAIKPAGSDARMNIEKERSESVEPKAVVKIASAPELAPVGTEAPAPQPDSTNAAAPALATLAKAIGSLGNAAAAAPTLSEGIALLGKLAANVDDTQVKRVQEAIASLQKGMDAAAEAANPSVKSLIGAIGATGDMLRGGSSGESNAPVLGDATSAPVAAPATASAPGTDMSAAEAAAATAALLPTALSVLSAASKLSDSEAASLEVVLRDAFNSADPSNPAAQAYAVLSKLTALTASPAGAPAGAPAVASAPGADRHFLTEAAPIATPAAIPDFTAQVAELEKKAAEASPDQKQDAEDALKLAKMVQEQAKAAAAYAPVAQRFQGFLNQFADAFQKASEMPLSEAELQVPKLEDMASPEQLRALSDAVAAEQSKATGAPVAAPDDYSNLKPLMGISSPEWVKAGRRIAKAFEIMNSQMAGAPVAAPGAAPAPAGASAGEPAPSAEPEIAKHVVTPRATGGSGLPPLSDVLSAIQALSNLFMRQTAETMAPAGAPTGAVGAEAAPASGAAPAPGPADAAEAMAAAAPAMAVVGKLLSGVLSGGDDNTLASFLPLVMQAANAAASAAASPAGAPAAAPAASDAATMGALTQFAKQISALSVQMTAESMPSWARDNFLAAHAEDAKKAAAAEAAAAPAAAPAAGLDPSPLMGILKSFAQQLSAVSTQMTAASMPSWARDNFLAAQAQDMAAREAGGAR